jgi:hypothetical protein
MNPNDIARYLTEDIHQNNGMVYDDLPIMEHFSEEYKSEIQKLLNEGKYEQVNQLIDEGIKQLLKNVAAAGALGLASLANFACNVQPEWVGGVSPSMSQTCAKDTIGKSIDGAVRTLRDYNMLYPDDVQSTWESTKGFKPEVWRSLSPYDIINFKHDKDEAADKERGVTTSKAIPIDVWDSWLIIQEVRTAAKGSKRRGWSKGVQASPYVGGTEDEPWTEGEDRLWDAIIRECDELLESKTLAIKLMRQEYSQEDIDARDAAETEKAQQEFLEAGWEEINKTE